MFTGAFKTSFAYMSHLMHLRLAYARYKDVCIYIKYASIHTDAYLSTAYVSSSLSVMRLTFEFVHELSLEAS